MLSNLSFQIHNFLVMILCVNEAFWEVRTWPNVCEVTSLECQNLWENVNGFLLKGALARGSSGIVFGNFHWLKYAHWETFEKSHRRKLLWERMFCLELLGEKMPLNNRGQWSSVSRCRIAQGLTQKFWGILERKNVCTKSATITCKVFLVWGY